MKRPDGGTAIRLLPARPLIISSPHSSSDLVSKLVTFYFFLFLLYKFEEDKVRERPVTLATAKH